MTNTLQSCMCAHVYLMGAYVTAEFKHQFMNLQNKFPKLDLHLLELAPYVMTFKDANGYFQ